MKVESKFSIGDVVYRPVALSTTVEEPCPDCLGMRSWIAKLPSGEEFPIECPVCRFGYESRGTVKVSTSRGEVQRMTIGSVRIDTAADPDRRVEYMCRETGIGSGSVWQEPDLYEMCEEAEAELPRLVEEHKIQLEESRARSRSKKRHDGPGSMAAYYRAQVRAARREIEAAERGLEREAKKGGRS